MGYHIYYNITTTIDVISDILGTKNALLFGAGDNDIHCIENSLSYYYRIDHYNQLYRVEMVDIPASVKAFIEDHDIECVVFHDSGGLSEVLHDEILNISEYQFIE